MEQRLSILTLGVQDIKATAKFYEVIGWKQIEHEHGDSIVFFQCNGMVIALYPRELLAQDIGVQTPEKHSDIISNVTLAYNVSSREEVHAVYNTIMQGNGQILKEPMEVFWGGYHFYFADPDGHVWEVAHNPFTLPDAHGNFVMQEKQ